MKYAIISINGKQFKVSEDQQIVVDHITGKVGEKITVTEVNLMGDEKSSEIGTPFVKNGSVTLEIVETGKADKIRVATYKAKSRSRKVRGHKQGTHTLKVVSILAK